MIFTQNSETKTFFCCWKMGMKQSGFGTGNLRKTNKENPLKNYTHIL